MDMQNTQAAPGQTMPYIPEKRPRGKFLILSLIVVILAVAYVASAYFLDFWPFLPPDPGSLFAKSFNNLFKVNTASYEINAVLKAQDRESDAEKLSSELLQYTSPLQPMFDRDNDRVRDIGIIKGKLQDFFYKNKFYPNSMDLAGITITKDPSGKVYEYKSLSGQDFNLLVEFETEEAIDAVSGKYSYTPPKIDGKKATFNKDSLSYFYSYSELKPKLPEFINIVSFVNGAILYLPSDTDINLDVSGMAQSQQEKVPDTSLKAGVSAKFSDMSYNAGAELLKKDENIYFKLNQFPSLFLGNTLDKIKQKWIQIKPDDLTDYGVGDLVKKDNELKQQVLEQLKSLFNLAITDQVLAGSDKAEKEKIGGKIYYKYSLSFNKDKVKNFYKDLTEKFNEEFKDSALIKFDQATYDYMQSPAFDTLYDYIDKNAKFYYYVDPQSEYPFMFKYQIRLVPDEQASSSGFFGYSKPASDKEFILTLSVSLKDINKTIKIDAPQDFMPFMDAQIAMTGQTKEQYLMQKQITNIAAIRKALTYYYLFSGQYPSSLDELKKTYKEIKFVSVPKLRDNNETYLYKNIETYKKQFESVPLMKNIPADAYSGNPYQYQRIVNDPKITWGEDYNIIFSINLPPYEKGKMPPYSIYRNYGSLNKTTNQYENLYDLIYVNGINYGSAFSSESAKPAYSTDSDKDGIADDFETYLGTNINNKDTDNDGVIDGDELRANSNPLGPGKLSTSY